MSGNERPAYAEVAEVPPFLQMMQMLSGFQVSQALYVVADLDVATALAKGPRTVTELAAATGADPDALRRVIRFLTPLGVFRLNGDMVEATALGAVLADGRPDSARGLARYWMKTHYAPFGSLLHTVHTGETAATHSLGKPFFDWVSESPELIQIQNAAMAGGGNGVRAGMLTGYRLPAGATVADIGGADGSLLCQLLADDPGRRGIVFDLPDVVSQAHATLQAAGIAGRVEAVGGDFFDSVPAADVYVMSEVLHDWDDEPATRILRNIGKAATPGARLVLIESVLPADGTPHPSIMMDLVMLAMLGGRERTAAGWEALLQSGGFTLDRIISSEGAVSSVIEATLH